MKIPTEFTIIKTVELEPNNADAISGTDFSTIVTLEGQLLQFRFTWNGYYQHYSLDILRSDGTRAKKFYPTVDELLLIRNFNPNSAVAPDACIGIIDTSGNEEPILPSKMGKSHIVLLLLGRVTQE